jgi:hypothetical protein
MEPLIAATKRHRDRPDLCVAAFNALQDTIEGSTRLRHSAFFPTGHHNPNETRYGQESGRSKDCTRRCWLHEQHAQVSRGWLGCPRMADDVQGLDSHAATDDVCIRSITSHAAVLPSINSRGRAEQACYTQVQNRKQTEVSEGNLTSVSGGLTRKNDGINWI